MRRSLLVWLACAPVLTAAQTLVLHYQERPPYSQVQPDGQVRGLVADPAVRALQQAGIPFVWARTPSQRQLALIQTEGAGLHCGIGWFRTAQRAALGRFSAALYRDPPLAALVRSAAWPAASASATTLLAERQLRLLIKDGYSYGPRLDRLIAAEAQSLAAAGLRQVSLSDEPEGPTRHLYCNLGVPAAWLESLDGALAAGPLPR